MESVYSGIEPVHRGVNPGVAFGSPLQGLSAYRGANFWFLVTYGLTELFQKESDNPTLSGWGYEFTMRVPLTPEPPDWAFGVLTSLAKVTRSNQMVFVSGHRLQTGHALAGLPTRLTAVAFTIDPELGAIDTPNGRLEFLLVVGITTEELESMKATSTAAVLNELADSISLVTDPGRAPAAG
ncbi:MAG TPA: suppressor of fused domain protein [Candidatus Dormibacteraeota bacterium]|nr:suppressor of fused domain protein [Candidatus Dormibacteraeota bacterium]